MFNFVRAKLLWQLVTDRVHNFVFTSAEKINIFLFLKMCKTKMICHGSGKKSDIPPVKLNGVSSSLGSFQSEVLSL